MQLLRTEYSDPHKNSQQWQGCRYGMPNPNPNPLLSVAASYAKALFDEIRPCDFSWAPTLPSMEEKIMGDSKF